MRRMLLALLSLSVAAAPARSALAKPPTEPAAGEALEPDHPEYKQAVEAGLDEYRLGHFEEARSLFQRAHAIDPNARTLRGLGMVEFELRHYVRAAQLLEAALASKRKPLTADQREAVDELLARSWQFIARYTVAVHPETAGVQFELDGRPVQLDSERRLTVEAGEHVLRVSAPDLPPRELRMDVKGGEHQTLHVELQAKPERAQRGATPVEPARREQGSAKPLLGIVLTGVGGALAAAGASLGIVALLDAKDAQAKDGADADRARALALAADVTLGVGIASAITGAVVLLVKRKAARERPKAAIRVESIFPAARVSF